MSNTYMIEVDSESVGIVVRDCTGYRFFSATPKFAPLDGRLFRNPRDAEREAAKFAQRRAPQAA